MVKKGEKKNTKVKITPPYLIFKAVRKPHNTRARGKFAVPIHGDRHWKRALVSPRRTALVKDNDIVIDTNRHGAVARGLRIVIDGAAPVERMNLQQ